ncbi:heavy-metal-associated domain-containing protein [Streptomyces sp. NPDC001876]|uniref:heavy-metal-associated domain-containing protein n=1 Tax=Streptomyces sp. NPDC001876 TaxID=3154402 RepID=UPI00332CB414
MSWFTSDGSRAVARGTTTTGTAGTTATVHRASGMTCGHGGTAVTRSVGALDEDVSTDVDVAEGLVTTSAGGQPDGTAIAAAVDDADHELTRRV